MHQKMKLEKKQKMKKAHRFLYRRRLLSAIAISAVFASGCGKGKDNEQTM